MVFQNGISEWYFKMVFQNGISLKIGKIAYELLYRGSSKYTIINLILARIPILSFSEIAR